MSRFRFLHAADIHLDSPMKGLRQRFSDDSVIERLDNKPNRKALDNLVELALREKVAFVILSGDLYDGSWKDSGTGHYMLRALSRLTAKNIPVYYVAGNHDADSVIIKELPMTAEIHKFPSKKPSTKIIEELKVALHGLSFETKSINNNVIPDFPSPEPGYFNIGILHTSLEGNYENHISYAPCSTTDLINKNYDYWALGHVHKHKIIHQDPWIVYPGVLQGRNIRETGASGVCLIDVEDHEVKEVRFVPCDVLRWEEVTIDLTSITSWEDMLDLAKSAFERAIENSGGYLLLVRCILTGATSLNDRILASHDLVDDISALLHPLNGDETVIALEKIECKTTLPQKELNQSQLSALDEALDDVLKEEHLSVTLKKNLTPLLTLLPHQIDKTMYEEEAFEELVGKAARALRFQLSQQDK
ncbi:metallophosphoesterase family protein [Aristophania vespae]|uniref:metallophosphoesterase family protein n=1 Tax=Aristophania vespae TaxID=2697033 RepID=UPI00235180C2|nr:DNA repair exonuclease [Aristophania vespae]UMM64015.1 hypothetical protein DM15PD_09960 [Aristophania vespae]